MDNHDHELPLHQDLVAQGALLTAIALVSLLATIVTIVLGAWYFVRSRARTATAILAAMSIPAVGLGFAVRFFLASALAFWTMDILGYLASSIKYAYQKKTGKAPSILWILAAAITFVLASVLMEWNWYETWASQLQMLVFLLSGIWGFFILVYAGLKSFRKAQAEQKEEQARANPMVVEL